MTTETKVILSGVLITIAVILGGVFFSSTKSGPTESKTPVDSAILVREDSRRMGSNQAPVMLVEFGDFQCPACAGIHVVIQGVLKTHASDVQYVFRNFPLPQHGRAVIASEAFETASEMGKGWEMQNKLYEQQGTWSTHSQPLDIFAGYAREIGLDETEFRHLMEQAPFRKKIDRDIGDGNLAGVNATPTFFLNGRLYRGQYSEEAFSSEIKKMIQESTP